MMRDVKPYLVPSTDDVGFGPWVYGDRDDVPLPEILEGWDPDTDVAIRQGVWANLENIRRACGLAPEEELILTVSWTGSASDMVEVGYRKTLSTEQVVDVILPSSRLGGTVSIRTTIALARSRVAATAGVVRQAGSVLADNVYRVGLEGNGAMFPISTIDFSTTSLGVDASWYLQTPPDLETPFLGGCLLMLNSRDLQLSLSLAAPRPTPAQSLLIDDLELGVATLLAQIAVRSRAELGARDWEVDSTGAVLAMYLAIAEQENLHWPSEHLEMSKFASRLVSALREQGFGRRLT